MAGDKEAAKAGKLIFRLLNGGEKSQLSFGCMPRPGEFFQGLSTGNGQNRLQIV